MTTIGELNITVNAVGAGDTVIQLNRVSSATKRAAGDTKKAGDKASNAAKTWETLKSAVALAGAAFGALKVGQAVFELAEFGAQADRATASLDALSGGQADQYLRAVSDAAMGTISAMDAAIISNKGLRFGLIESAEQMAEATRVAMAMGRTMGISTTKAINDMMMAAGRESKLIADNLGIVMDMNAVREEATRLLETGAAATEEAADKMAFFNVMTREGAEVLGLLEDSLDDTATSFEQFKASWSNFRQMVGGNIARTLEFIPQGLTHWLDGITGINAAFEGHRRELALTAGSYEAWVEGVNQMVFQTGLAGVFVAGRLRDTSVEAYRALRDEAKAAQELAQATDAAGEGIEDIADANIYFADTLDTTLPLIQNAISLVEGYVAALDRQGEVQLGLLQSANEFKNNLPDPEAFREFFMEDFLEESMKSMDLGDQQMANFYQGAAVQMGWLTEEQVSWASSMREIQNIYKGLIELTGDAEGLGRQYADMVSDTGTAEEARNAVLRLQNQLFNTMTHQARLAGDDIDLSFNRMRVAALTDGVGPVEEVQEALELLSDTQGYLNIDDSDAQKAYKMILAIRAQLDSMNSMIIRPKIHVSPLTGVGSGYVPAGGGMPKGGRFEHTGGVAGPNMPAIVGERGPEYFIPHSSGRVIPEYAMGGGGGEPVQTVNNVFNITHSGDTQQLIREMRYELRAQGLDFMEKRV